jgi:hypothetical protein
MCQISCIEVMRNRYLGRTTDSDCVGVGAEPLLDPSERERSTTVDKFRVHPEQHRDAVPCPCGDPGWLDTRREPARHARAPQVVGPFRQRRLVHLGREDCPPGRRPYAPVDRATQPPLRAFSQSRRTQPSGDNRGDQPSDRRAVGVPTDANPRPHPRLCPVAKEHAERPGRGRCGVVAWSPGGRRARLRERDRPRADPAHVRPGRPSRHRHGVALKRGPWDTPPPRGLLVTRRRCHTCHCVTRSCLNCGNRCDKCVTPEPCTGFPH